MRHPACPARLCYLRPAARDLYPPEGPLPATADAAGLDLRACLDADEAVIPAGGRLTVPTGLALQLLVPGVAAFIYSRSGLGARQGLTVAQGVGVVDPDYRGEILVVLLNTSGQERRLRRGERMAQLVLQPFFRADIALVSSLDATERGDGGFGHTGRQ